MFNKAIIIFLILLLAPAVLAQGCTTKKKIECFAASATCGAICVCDIPVCECCVECMGCVAAMCADCCECLFPGWSGCNSYTNTTEPLPETVISKPELEPEVVIISKPELEPEAVKRTFVPPENNCCYFVTGCYICCSDPNEYACCSQLTHMCMCMPMGQSCS